MIKTSYKKERKEKGITLIALVITIVVLLILAGVSITALVGENGLITRAKLAAEKTNQSVQNDITAMEELNQQLENLINGGAGGNTTGDNEPEKTPIDKVEPKVGYYADFDTTDGKIDGVIYADLAFSKSGQWMDSNGRYSYAANTNTKDYYISQTNYEGPFGPKDVLTALDGEGEDRFYVMALEDFDTGTYYCWYDAAYGKMDDYESATSLDFGIGKANTEAMIAIWDSGAYGEQNDNGTYLDLWGPVQYVVASEWFVPSRGEWSAFGDNLEITEDNYVSFGLSDSYWSSSQFNSDGAWLADFYGGSMNYDNVDIHHCVRLSAAF